MAATILIADDDAVQRRLVENMVQRGGYEAVVVDSGDAALARLTDPDATPIDVLIGQHAAIIDAIARHAPDEAEAATRTHLSEILLSLPRLAQAHPELFAD